MNVGRSGGATGDAGAAGQRASGGDVSTGGEPNRLGADAPGTWLDPTKAEVYALGYYTVDPASQGTAGLLAPQQSGIIYGNEFGQAGSRPYVIGSPAPCGTHAEATEFAGFGVVYGDGWHNSLHDFYWTWGLDEKYDGTEGAAPWPAVWNGVLVGFEMVTDGSGVHGKFTVDWKQHWWRDKTGVVVLDFTPDGLSADVPAYPVIGRWRRDYGERLGLYQDGAFYLDWDGDNSWDAQKDRVLHFDAPGEYPVAADFWPGGGDEIGLYKDGIWYLDANQNGTWDGVAGGDLTREFGNAGSLPVVSRDGWTRDCPI